MSPSLRRRMFLGATVSTGVVGLAGSPAGAAATPVVDMAKVLVAAQAEGLYGDKAWIEDGPSTKLVQQALAAKGFATTVDGWFGPGTSAAYAAFQRSLGYSGLGANGIPGPTSLANLGQGRFTITNRVALGAIGTVEGYRVNARTRQMLAAADAAVSWSLRLSQGSYNPGGDPTSMGTHDGGGVVDIVVTGLTTEQRWRSVKALRTVGFAAWYRTPSQGNWPYHLHAVAIADSDLSRVAANQVADYATGRDGLKNHDPDGTPSSGRAAFYLVGALPGDLSVRPDRPV